MSAPVGSRIFVHGTGAVSPAGWGAAALVSAIRNGEPLPRSEVQATPTRKMPLRRVPPPAARPPWLAHPRLRRTGPITQFAVGAALEALGRHATPADRGGQRLGVIGTVMSGSVLYSRRFYAEVLENPATASPMLFPETVFNAPASHVAAILETAGPNYTLVADQTGFLSGLELAADWLQSGRVDGCLVVAAEEADWITGEAHALFARGDLTAEGAAALYLRTDPADVELSVLTGTTPFRRGHPRAAAALRVRSQLPAAEPDTPLFTSIPAGLPGRSGAPVWSDWPAPRFCCAPVLGEGLAAAGGWACVAAVHHLQEQRLSATYAAVHGLNLGAAAAGFTRTSGRA